jgi:hypothetical protein
MTKSEKVANKAQQRKEEDDWWLADGEERNRLHPTFQVPSAETRHTLRVGELVKLCFEDGEGGERMWVLVTAVEDVHYIGTLNNHPFSMPLHFSQRIEFLPKHIIDHIPNTTVVDQFIAERKEQGRPVDEAGTRKFAEDILSGKTTIKASWQYDLTQRLRRASREQ